MNNGIPRGVFGPARVPGPLAQLPSTAAAAQHRMPRPAPAVPARKVGIAGALEPVEWQDDLARQRLLAVRHRVRELIKDQLVPRDGMLLYSGIPDQQRASVMRALTAATGQSETLYIEQTEAGKYLEVQSSGLLTEYLGSDWAAYAQVSLGEADFKVSILGFWRELSARFAKLASGEVHVVLPPDRLHLPESGEALRKSRGDGEAPTVSWKELKTFGFVEFPILFGLISKNAGVTGIRVYEWQGGNKVTFSRRIAVSKG